MYKKIRIICGEPLLIGAIMKDVEAWLDPIVRLIAANMVAEACSIYGRLADGSFQLLATVGLCKQAIRITRMKPGEGLVGLIGRTGEPVNIANAEAHPAFSYRPETGEEIYQSFLGVPMIGGGRTIGVLTVQNDIARTYSEEEVELLQTIAMITADMLSTLFESLNASTLEARPYQKHTITGVTMSEGIALGHVELHELRVSVTKLFADNIDIQRGRLDIALGKLRDHAHRDVLEGYRMLAYDQGWVKRLHQAIDTGLTAEAAVEQVQSDRRATTMRQTDPYWKERLHDLDDLSDRLLHLLTGNSATATDTDLPRDTILIASTMGPAELLGYDRKRIRGLVLVDGCASSHVAIVAKALGIPTIGCARDGLEEADPGDPAVLDADAGILHLRPSLEVIRAYADKARSRARRQKHYDALRNTPAITKDGKRISLNINAGLQVDLPHLARCGADGIGLYRTELEFMIVSTFPRIHQQTEMYSKIIKGAGGKPVVFRSLDIGGNKLLPHLQPQPEENPALGWRAIRIALDRPGLFRTQIRALLHARQAVNCGSRCPLSRRYLNLSKRAD